VEPDEADVTLKIPKLIVKRGMDYRQLFTLTAVVEKPGDETLKVQMVPEKGLNAPLETVKIDPMFVKLVQQPVPQETGHPGKKP
jgi:hypothetical protein